MDQTNAFWRFDHLIECRVHEVQGTPEWAVFEVTFPHKQSEFLGGLPCMRIEHCGPGKSVDPTLGLCDVLNARRKSEGQWVQWNRHYRGACLC